MTAVLHGFQPILSKVAILKVMFRSTMPLSRRIQLVLASRWFWYATFGLFLLQALWLAFSAQYPMAFDENYHFGLIQLHAQQWLPFFTHQPAHAQAVGEVARDPSYLYHWLLSLPYRLIRVFTHDQTTQIIWLRLINVALFAWALVLYRRVMRRLGLSAAFTHAALLAFTLIPVVPFLAAHINYDNLLMVVVPLVTLQAMGVLEGLREKRLPLARLIELAAVLLLGSLIKYPFLPVLAVVALYIAWRIRREGLYRRPAFVTAWQEWRRLSRFKEILFVVILLVAAGLFLERYAINVVHYHTPAPSCAKVISQDECLEYGPWARDYGLSHTKAASFHPNLVTYVGDWFFGMWYRLFFAVGPSPDYATRAPFPVISYLAILVAVLLFVGIVLRARRVFIGHPKRVLLLLLIVGYGAALFLDNYFEYVRTAAPVAINGRYWIPFLPFFFALGGIAWSDLLGRRPAIKVWAVTAVLAVLLLQGGGAMTFIVRSDASWDWQNTFVQRVNGDVRTVVSPVILGKGIIHT